MTLLYFSFFSNLESLLYLCVCNKLWYGIECICNSHSTNSQLSGEFMLLTFNSYTGKFGFERESASPATNLTARHCKNIYSIQWIQGTLLFFSASASCQKVLNAKSIFNTVKNFRANFVFQGKRRVTEKSWMVRNILNTVKNFRASASCSKILNCKKYIQCSVFSVYSLGGDPCNLD